MARTLRLIPGALATLLVCGGLVGCQTTVGGLLLPSPYYVDDDVQFFAEGPEFKLPKESAAQQALKAQREAGAP